MAFHIASYTERNDFVVLTEHFFFYEILQRLLVNVQDIHELYK